MSKLNTLVQAVKANRVPIAIKAAQGAALVGAYVASSVIIAKRRPTIIQNFYGADDPATDTE